MKSIKDFMGGAAYRLRKLSFAAASWLQELSAVKVMALIVLNCFLLTSVYGQSVAAIADSSRANQQFKQIFENYTLPYSHGKITSSNFSGSDTVVINIQDLHSHPEVQKNISKIIEGFDKKFGVKQIYLEGAYGALDTSWLTAIGNKDIAVKVMDEMLESGRLTGAEYYSAISGRTDVIKGLEKKDEYLMNLQRFGKILEEQNEIKIILDSLSADTQRLKSIYYNRQQNKLEELSKQYTKGEVEPRKYFALLYKHADKLGIDIEKYENIDAYKALLEQEKGLDYKRISLELNSLVLKLKEFLPLSAYKMILDNTNSFSEADKLYIYLMKISKEYDLNLDINFSNLNKFFNYIELSQKINPLEMIKEEQKLVDEINEKFSVNASERDIVFLVSFQRYYRDFLSSKITSDDYQYYEANKNEFKKLWIKYVDNKKLEMLADYEKMAEDFYCVNIDRNKYFFDNIEGLNDSGTITEFTAGETGAEKVVNSLSYAKNIYVIVTGGFHTQGVSDYLAEHKISTIAITPNVSGGLEFAEEKYYQIAKEQSKILFQTLAVLNTTQASDIKKLELAVQAISNALDQNWREVEIVIQDMLKSKSYEGMRASMREDGKDIIFTFEKEGSRTVTVTYNKDNKEVKALQAPEIMEMSAASRKPIAAASSIALAVSGITLLLASPLALSVLPIVAGLSALMSASYLGYTAYQIQKLNEMSKNSIVESGTVRVELRIIERLQEALPADLFADLISNMAKPDFSMNRFKDLTSKVSEIEALLNEIDSIAATKTSKKRKKSALRRFDRQISEKERDIAAVLNKVNADYGLDFKTFDDLQNYIASMLSDGIDDNKVATSFENNAVHLNHQGLKTLFFDKDNVIRNKRLLEVFVRHELKHAEYAAKAEAGEPFAKFIHSNAVFEELVVSAKDFPNHIASYAASVRNWFAALRDAASGLLGRIINSFAPNTLSPELVDAFREYMVSQYGEDARNSVQTNIQILAARYIAKFSDVHLGTGGGKTNAGRLALAQILMNTGRDISFTGGLYMTKDSQIVGDIRGFDAFINSPEINQILAESGVVRRNRTLKFGYVITNEQGEKVFYVVEKGKETIKTVNSSREKYTFADLQNECAVVGGVMSDFSHLYQQGQFSSNKTAFFGLNDEGHESLSDKANSPNSIAGNVKVKNAEATSDALGEIFQLALDIRDSNEKAGAVDGRYKEYTLRSRQIKLSETFGYEFESYKAAMSEIQKKYPFLNEADIRHYIESSLTTMYSNTYGKDYIVENGKVVLLSGSMPQYGQTKKDWGHLLLEKWAEKEGHADMKGAYTLESKTLSQQTNAVFIDRVFGDKYVAYSGSLMDISKKVKRLYGRSVKFIKSSEVSEQADMGTEWVETESEKLKIIAQKIADAVKDGHSSVPVRIESYGEAVQIQQLLESTHNILPKDVLIFATEGTTPDGWWGKGWDNAARWSNDRDGFIDVLKTHLQTPARVALVTSAASTGVDLRTNLKNGVDVFKSFDTVTGSYVLQEQYRGRVGRAGDQAEYARVYSLESLEQFRNVDTASSDLIDKIAKAVEKNNIKKANKLYKELQDMIYDEEIAQSERVKRQGDMLDRAALEFEALNDAYTKADKNGDITGWHELVFGKEPLDYETIGKTGYPHITNKNELIRRGKWLTEQYRVMTLRMLKSAYSDFLRAIEESSSRSSYMIGDTFSGFLQQVAENDPEIENNERFNAALSDYFSAVQRKAMRSILIDVPANPKKNIENYKINSAVFGDFKGRIYNPFPTFFKSIIGKPVAAILKLFDVFGPVMIRSFAALMTSAVLLAPYLAAYGINIAAFNSLFASIPLLGSIVTAISALAAPQLILLAAAGFLITLLIKNLITDRIAKYDQESDRKTAVSNFRADPTFKGFFKAAFAVLNKALTTIASTSVFGAIGVLFIGFFVPSVLPLAVIFAAIGIAAGLLAALININKIMVMSKATPDKSSSVSINMITGIGLGALLFGVVLGFVSALPAVLFAGLLIVIQYAGKTDYFNFKKAAIFTAVGFGIVAIPGILFATGILSAAVAVSVAVAAVMGLMVVMAVSGAIIRARAGRHINQPVEDLSAHIEVSTPAESRFKAATKWISRNASLLLKPSVIKISAVSIAVTLAAIVSPYLGFGVLLILPVIIYKPFKVMRERANQNKRKAIITGEEWNKIETMAARIKNAGVKQQELRAERIANQSEIAPDESFYGIKKWLKKIVSSRPFNGFVKATVSASAAIVVVGATSTVAYAQETDDEAVPTATPDDSVPFIAPDEVVAATEEPVIDVPAETEQEPVQEEPTPTQPSVEPQSFTPTVAAVESELKKTLDFPEGFSLNDIDGIENDINNISTDGFNSLEEWAQYAATLLKDDVQAEIDKYIAAAGQTANEQRVNELAGSIESAINNYPNLSDAEKTAAVSAMRSDLQELTQLVNQLEAGSLKDQMLVTVGNLSASIDGLALPSTPSDLEQLKTELSNAISSNADIDVIRDLRNQLRALEPSDPLVAQATDIIISEIKTLLADEMGKSIPSAGAVRDLIVELKNEGLSDTDADIANANAELFHIDVFANIRNNSDAAEYLKNTGFNGTKYDVNATNADYRDIKSIFPNQSSVDQFFAEVGGPSAQEQIRTELTGELDKPNPNIDIVRDLKNQLKSAGVADTDPLMVRASNFIIDSIKSDLSDELDKKAPSSGAVSDLLNSLIDEGASILDPLISGAYKELPYIRLLENIKAETAVADYLKNVGFKGTKYDVNGANADYRDLKAIFPDQAAIDQFFTEASAPSTEEQIKTALTAELDKPAPNIDIVTDLRDQLKAAGVADNDSVMVRANNFIINHIKAALSDELAKKTPSSGAVQDIVDALLAEGVSESDSLIAEAKAELVYIRLFENIIDDQIASDYLRDTGFNGQKYDVNSANADYRDLKGIFSDEASIQKFFDEIYGTPATDPRVLQMEEALRNNGYTFERAGTDDNIYYIVSKYGLTIEVYPFNRSSEFVFNIDALNNIFDTYNTFKNVLGYEVEYQSTTADDGTIVPYFNVSLTYKGQPITKTIWPTDSSFNLGNEIYTFDTFKLFVDNGYKVTFEKDNNGIFRFILSRNGLNGIEEYPFDLGGNRRIDINKVNHLFNTYDELKKIGNVTYHTTTASDGTIVPYFNVSLKYKGQSITKSVWPTDSSFNLGNEIYIFDTFKLFVDNGYKAAYEKDNNDTFRFVLSRNGLNGIEEYPFDLGGNRRIDINKVNHLFGAYDELKKIGNVTYHTTTAEDGTIVPYFNVTAKHKGQTLSVDVYPFDSNFSISDTKYLFNTFKTLVNNGYRVNYEKDENGIYHFAVTDKNGLTIKVYPFNSAGNQSFNISKIKDVFKAYNTLAGEYGANNVAPVTDVDGNLKFLVTYALRDGQNNILKDKYGKEIIMQLEIYPFNSSGNYSLKLEKVRNMFDAYGQLALEFGLDYVSPMTDANDSFFFRVFYNPNDDSKYFDVYIFDKLGKYIFDIDSVRIMIEAIKNGRNGAYIPVKNDNALQNAQDSKNRILSDLALQLKSEADEQSGIAEYEDTRSWFRKFIDWLAGLFGYVTESAKAAEEGRRAVQRANAPYAELEYDESTVLNALGSLNEIEYIKDSEGNIIGREEVTVAGVRKITTGEDAGTFVYLYQKEYFSNESGTMESVGTEYFVEYKGTMYRLWFTTETQDMIDASVLVSIETTLANYLNEPITELLTANDNKRLGDMQAAFDVGNDYELWLSADTKAVFTPVRDGKGDITGTKVKVYRSDASGQWSETASSDFAVSGGYGAFVSSMLYIDEDTNGEGVYFASAFSLNELENNPRFVSRWNGNALEQIYMTNDGNPIHLQQTYGGYYDIKNQERNQLLAGIEAGTITDAKLSPSRVFVGGKIVVVDNNGVESEPIDANSPEGLRILRQANIVNVNGMYFDNDAVSINQEGNKVVVKNTDDNSGYVFEGSNTGQYNEEGAPVYRIGQKLSQYVTVDYADLGISDEHKENLDELFNLVNNEQGFNFKYNPENLIWTETQTFDGNGNVLYTSWAAYDGHSSEPVVEITKDGFVDFSGSYNDINIGLRYDVNLPAEGQKPLNLVIPVEGVGTVVVNYYDGSVFVEDRADDGYLRSKYHITSADSSQLFENHGELFPDTGYWRTSMDSYMSDWQAISETEDIASMIRSVNAIGNGEVLKVTKREDYSYEDVTIDTSLRPNIQGEYSGGVLAFYGIPSNTKTYSVDENGRPLENAEPLSESTFDGIDWDKRRTYTNERLNTIVDNANVQYREIEKESDFNGNILQQFDIENGRYVSGIIVPEYNRYGIGLKSYNLVFEEGKCIVVSTSEFNSRVSANAIVYDNNVNTIMFAHERTQVEDVNPLIVDESLLDSGTLNMFGMQSSLLDENGDLRDRAGANKIFTEKSYILNNAEGRNIITLSNLLLDEDGEIVKASSRDPRSGEMEVQLGMPSIISFGRYSEDLDVNEEQRQMMIGHPATVVSYAYAGTLNFDVYGAQDSQGNLLENAQEAFEESDYIMRMNNLKIVESEIDGKKTVSLVYTVYSNPNFDINNVFSGYIQRSRIHNSSLYAHQEQAVARYYSQMSGLKASSFKSDGLKFFEIYNYPATQTPLGNVNMNAYEVNVLNRMGRAEYGFLLNDDNTDFVAGNSIEEWDSFIHDLYAVDDEISALRDEHGDLASIAADARTRPVIPFNINGLRISRIWSKMDISYERGRRYVNHHYFEVNHLNTGEEPVMISYKYKYDNTGVLIKKEQSDIGGDWTYEFKKIWYGMQELYAENKPLAILLSVIIVGLPIAAIIKIHRSGKKAKKKKAEIMKRGGIAKKAPAADVQERGKRKESEIEKMPKFVSSDLKTGILSILTQRYVEQWGVNKTDMIRTLERPFIGNFIRGETTITSDLDESGLLAAVNNAIGTGENVDQIMFDDYRWWVRNVMAQSIEDESARAALIAETAKNFTQEDLVLFYYIYIATMNMRQDDMAFRNALFYNAKKMIAEGNASNVGVMIDTEANRMLKIVERGISIEQQVEQMKAVNKAREESGKKAIKKFVKAIAYYEANKEEVDELEGKYRTAAADAANFDNLTAEMDKFFSKYGFRLLFGVKGAGGRGKMRQDETMTYYDFDAMFRKPSYVAAYNDMVARYAGKTDANRYSEININNTDLYKLEFEPQLLPFRVYIPHSGDFSMNKPLQLFTNIMSFKSMKGLLQALTNIKGMIVLWLGNLTVIFGVIAFVQTFAALGVIGALGPAALVIVGGLAVTALVYFGLTGLGKLLQRNPVNEFYGKTVANSEDRGLSSVRSDIKSATKAMGKRWGIVLALKTIWEFFLLNTVVQSIIATLTSVTSVSAMSLTGIGLTTLINPVLFTAVVVIMGLSFYINKARPMTAMVNKWFTDTKTGEPKYSGKFGRYAPQVLAQVLAIGSTIGVVLGFWGLFHVATGYMFIALLVLPFILFTFLDFFGFWDVAKAMHIWTTRKKDGYFVGKKWSSFQKFFYGTKTAQEDIDAGIENIRKSEFYNDWAVTFLPEDVEQKLTDEQKTVAFAMYFNQIMMSYYRTSKISAEEYEKYKFDISDYTGGNNLDRQITKIPDLSSNPSRYGARELFYRLHQETSVRAVQGLRNPNVRDISMAPLIPTFDEGVTYLLDEKEGKTGESLNSENLNPDGHTLLTHLIRGYDGEWANMISRLEQGVDFRGRQHTLNEDDLEFIEQMKTMLDSEGNVIAGRKLRRADGSKLPDSWAKSEISRWADEKLQPLSPTQLGVLNLREALDFLAEIEFADTRDERSEQQWQNYIHNDVTGDSFEFISGYQNFGAVYKDGAGINDSRIIGLFNNLKEYREMIVPVMHRQDFNYSRYLQLKRQEDKVDAEGNSFASPYEMTLISQIEKTDIGKNWKNGIADDKIIQLSTFRHLKAEDVSYSEYLELKNKVENDNAKLSEIALYDAVTAEIEKLKPVYERWKSEGREAALVGEYEAKGEEALFDHNKGVLTVVVFDDTGTTVSPVHGVQGMGKVDHHTHLEGDISKNFVLQMDMNQNIFVQSALTFFIGLQPLLQDEEVYNVSLLEQIPTKRLTNIGAKGAAAEEGFNASHKDMDELWQLHMYGHPNILRTRFIQAFSGQSKGLVSEDATAGKSAKVKGGKTVALDGVVVEKTREAEMNSFTGMFTKFSSGSAEMNQSSYIYEYNQALRKSFGFFGGLMAEATDFVAGPGFYAKERLVTITVKVFLFAILFLGISGFSGFTFAFVLALAGLTLSQTSALTGMVKDFYTYGESFLKWIKKLGTNFAYFVTQIQTHSYGYDSGLSGKAAHVNTGRGSGTIFGQLLPNMIIKSSDKDLAKEAKKAGKDGMAAFDSHFITSVASILVIAAALFFSFSTTFFLSILYIMIPVAVILGQTQLKQGFNIFQYPKDVVFKNIGNEFKRLGNIVFSKNVRETRNDNWEVEYIGRPEMPRFLAFFVGGIVLTILALSSIFGMVIVNVSGILGKMNDNFKKSALVNSIKSNWSNIKSQDSGFGGKLFSVLKVIAASIPVPLIIVGGVLAGAFMAAATTLFDTAKIVLNLIKTAAKAIGKAIIKFQNSTRNTLFSASSVVLGMFTVPHITIIALLVLVPLAIYGYFSQKKSMDENVAKIAGLKEDVMNIVKEFGLTPSDAGKKTELSNKKKEIAQIVRDSYSASRANEILKSFSEEMNSLVETEGSEAETPSAPVKTEAEQALEQEVERILARVERNLRSSSRQSIIRLQDISLIGALETVTSRLEEKYGEEIDIAIDGNYRDNYVDTAGALIVTLGKHETMTLAEREKARAVAEIAMNEKMNLLGKYNFAIAPRTTALSTEEINDVAETLKSAGIDPETSAIIVPARIILLLNSSDQSAPNSWLNRTISNLENAGLAITMENLINPPFASAVIRNIKKSVQPSKMLTEIVESWIINNIVPARVGKSIDASMMIYAAKERLDVQTSAEVEKALQAGLTAVAVERISSRQNRNQGYEKISPNTVVIVEFEGTQYRVKVEQYISESKGIPVIQSLVLQNANLNTALKNAGKNISEVYESVYFQSIKHFAVDINENKKQMQHNLGVNGVGMIVNMSDGMGSRDMDIDGVLIKSNTQRGVFELSESDRKQYTVEENGIAGHMAGIFGQIAAEKEYGRTWQKPGYGYGLTLNTDRSRVLSNEYTTSRFVNTEKEKNVETIRVSNSNIRDVLASLSKEKSNAKKADVDKIKNILNSDKDLSKIVDLPNLSELITSSGELNAEGVTLIQRAFENGFTGIHTDASSITDIDVLRKALGDINSISRKSRPEFSNYVSFIGVDSDTSIKAEDINILAMSYGFTPVIKIGEKGEEITPKKVKEALGNIENAAVEIQGISTGDELSEVQGRIVLAWLHTTSGISKDKSRAKTGAKRLKSAYRGALTSDYITDMNASEIAGLRKYMSEAASEDADIRKEQFASMTRALNAAQISENSALYNYILEMRKENTLESYESARGYLRGAVEKYLEREYMKALDISADIYNKKIDINDRNAIRGLLLYMSVNGEGLNSQSIKELLKQQRELLNSETGTLVQLRMDSNSLINEILEDPLAADVSFSKEKVANAKKAFTVLTDSLTSNFGFDRAIESARQGTLVSADAIRSLLAAA